MLNTPITEEEREFKIPWIKHREVIEIDNLLHRRFLTIDTAISKAVSADFTGIIDNCVDKDNFWNLRAYKFKIDPKELIDLLFNWHEKNNYEKIGIEKTIYLQAIKPFLDDEMRKRNKFLPIVELLHNQIQKETRIRGLIPRYESGSIFHIKGECKPLEDELYVFPKGLHDDVLDALAYQHQIAEAPAMDIEETLQIVQNRNNRKLNEML
jgi:phage terminase large subunit-like protein